MGGSEPQGREWGVHSSGCSRFDQEEIERAGGIPMDAVIGAGMGFPGPVQPDGYVEGLRQLRMARSEPAEDFE